MEERDENEYLSHLGLDGMDEQCDYECHYMVVSATIHSTRLSSLLRYWYVPLTGSEASPSNIPQVLLWAIQIQSLLQIIINRISILMVNRHNAWKLKLIVFLVLLAINISVFCVWIPARLQISSKWIAVNAVWDRVEKCIFLVVDAGLNFYFIYLVRSRLIANGLTKYTRLYRVNLFMIAVSMTMDVSEHLTRSN